MAFNNTARKTEETNDNWKATAFVNIYVPTSEGGRRKIGALALKDSKPYEAQLIARLQEDGGMQAFVDAVQFDFQLADQPVHPLGF